MSDIQYQRLPNGLHLLAEPIAASQSLAMTLLTPAGLVREPVGEQGVGAMLAELVCRGAGERSAREHSDALDRLGVDRSVSIQTHHLGYAATMIGSQLDAAFPLLMDMVRRPRFDAETFEPTRDLALQALDALADEPQQRAMIELKARHYPQPLGRSALGQRADLEALTMAQVQAFWRANVVPTGSILAFAGCYDWQQLCDVVAASLGDWAGEVSPVAVDPTPPRCAHHLDAQTTQVHLTVAYDAVPEVDDASLLQKMAVAVLSGGMSGRLFTEVREKRGLCYAVYAAYAGQRDRGAVMSYAGTTTPRAQETLDVMIGELRRLSEGVAADEFERALVGMKSRLVMQGESTAARSGAIASEQFVYGRPHSLDQWARRIDAITLEQLNHFVGQNRPGDMTVVSIGPQALQVETAV